MNLKDFNKNRNVFCSVHIFLKNSL